MELMAKKQYLKNKIAKQKKMEIFPPLNGRKTLILQLKIQLEYSAEKDKHTFRLVVKLQNMKDKERY